mmetsp:Transcript_47336/g.115275  ORF Transcript_47336/g.115275 Transcript_47336/m.115275 type:complete len:101 (-) Transcript_47336:418-720(-)
MRHLGRGLITAALTMHAAHSFSLPSVVLLRSLPSKGFGALAGVGAVGVGGRRGRCLDGVPSGSRSCVRMMGSTAGSAPQQSSQEGVWAGGLSYVVLYCAN